MPGFCASKEYEIRWGDNKTEKINLTAETIVKHVYDLRNFSKNCNAGEIEYSLNIKNSSCSNDNKGYLLTFKKRPEAKPVIQAACEGTSLVISNNSCPSTNITYLWEFSDGRTSTAFTPSILFTDPNQNYKVKLTATSKTCGASSAEANFKVSKLPVAAFSTIGTTVVNQDTVVCFSSGGVLTIDGSISQDEKGYSWQITGGKSTYQDKTNSSSPIIKIKLDEVKEYTITLTAANECGSKKITRIYKVIALPAATLTPQPDVCEEIKYKISNPASGVIYTLNGKPLDATQEISLPVATIPYIVTASISNACGTQMVSDTFTVATAQPVKIISLPKDTIICVSNTPLPLLANIAGGTWSLPGVEKQNNQTVFVPKTSGDYTVSYTKGTGKCLVTDAVHIKVDGIHVTATAQTVCSGTPFVKLQGSPAGGKWTSQNCSGCIKGDTLLTANLTTGLITVTYEAGNQSGCKASATAIITISQPKANFTITGGCIGGAVKPVNNSTGAGSYVWLVNNIQVSSEASPALTLSSGIQNITLIAKAGNCADTIRKQVTIVSPPAPVSFTPSETLGCAPLKTTFQINGTVDPNAEYSWNFGNIMSYTGSQPPAQIFQNPDKINRTYTISLTSKNTCGQQSSSKEIVVRPLVQAEIGVDSTTLRCTPAQMLFSNRSVGHDKPLSRWIFGDGIIQQTGNDTLYHTFIARDSATTYHVKLEISSTCGLDTAEVAIRVFPTTVKALYTISKSIVCPGETIQFTDATVPKPNRWLWKFGDGSISTIANPTHSFTKAQSEFKITLIAYTGCGYDSTQLTVKTTTLPAGSFDKVSIACEATEVQFINKSDSQLGFIWDFGDGTPLDSANYSPAHAYSKPGNYTASLYAYRGVQTCKFLVQKSPVTVITSPVANFGFQGDSLFCAPGPVSFINLSENADSYQWFFSDGKTSDVKTPSIPFEPGLYSVKLVAIKGGACMDSVERAAAFVVQQCQVDIPEAFTPNGDGIGDRYTLFGDGILEINSLRIRNRWGEMVFEAKNIPAGSQQPEQSWDGTFGGKPAPSDMYIYEAEVRYIDNRISDKLRGNIYLVR